MKYDAKRAQFIFGMPMKPCPKCGGYNIRHQTPIQMKEPILAGDTARQIVGKWARAVRDGDNFVAALEAHHEHRTLKQGPAMDCTGRTAEDVGRDPVVASTVKRLWNEQAP